MIDASVKINGVTSREDSENDDRLGYFSVSTKKDCLVNWIIRIIELNKMQAVIGSFSLNTWCT